MGIIDINQALTSISHQLDINAYILEKNDITVVLDYGHEKHFYTPIYKKLVTKENLGQLILKFKDGKAGLLVSDYINPNIADILKDAGIFFIDKVGNCFIEEKTFKAFVIGKKEVKSIHTVGDDKAFTVTELKILFLLLENPECLKKSLRAIADKADVSLGAASSTMKSLQSQNQFIRIGKNTLKFVNYEKTIERWVNLYNSKYKRKYIVGRYTSPQKKWWTEYDYARDGSILSGELAASKILKTIQPGQITLYSNEIPKYLLAKYKLTPDKFGEIEILKKFWSFDDEQINYRKKNKVEFIFAPMILVYADLLSTPDTRNIEAANVLYNDVIIPRFNEWQRESI